MTTDQSLPTAAELRASMRDEITELCKSRDEWSSRALEQQRKVSELLLEKMRTCSWHSDENY